MTPSTALGVLVALQPLALLKKHIQVLFLLDPVWPLSCPLSCSCFAPVLPPVLPLSCPCLGPYLAPVLPLSDPMSGPCLAPVLAPSALCLAAIQRHHMFLLDASPLPVLSLGCLHNVLLLTTRSWSKNKADVRGKARFASCLVRQHCDTRSLAMCSVS